MEGGVHLKLDVQGQRDGRILDVDGQGRWDVKKLTIFMVVICIIPNVNEMFL